MNNSILAKHEELARSKVGYREGPKNNETIFGAWFGMNFVAWCAIFQSWLSFFSGTTYLGAPWRFASTIAARDHAKKNGRWIKTPTVGTIAMMAHTKTTGHVGFVIYLLRRNNELIVGTVEGNTNDQGAREGNGVWLRERSSSSWDGYIVLDQTYIQDQPISQNAETQEKKMLWSITYKDAPGIWGYFPDSNRKFTFANWDQYVKATKQKGFGGDLEMNKEFIDGIPELGK